MAKKKKPEVPANAYVVRKAIEGEYNSDDIPNPSEQYYAVFATKEEALAETQKVERAEWLVNGTERDLFGKGVAGVSTMPEPVFRDWCEDVGIELPANSEHASWQSWWRRMRGTDRPINREQFLLLLQAMNLVEYRAYEVVPIDSQKLPEEPPKVGYAVVLQSWEYGDDWYYGANDALTLYLSQQKAQDQCDLLNRDADVRLNQPQGDYYWNGGPHQYVVVELPILPEA